MLSLNLFVFLGIAVAVVGGYLWWKPSKTKVKHHGY
jgi:hypothetical protein